MCKVGSNGSNDLNQMGLNGSNGSNRMGLNGLNGLNGSNDSNRMARMGLNDWNRMGSNGSNGWYIGVAFEPFETFDSSPKYLFEFNSIPCGLELESTSFESIRVRFSRIE